MEIFEVLLSDCTSTSSSSISGKRTTNLNIFWILLVLSLIVGGGAGKYENSAYLQNTAGSSDNGVLGISSEGNVTVLAGQRGEIKCRVTNIGNFTILFLRHRDTHLLSNGADSYTADSRFRAFQIQPSIWGLRISSTKPSDGGVYECQIGVTPPISAFTHLTVVEPITRIEGLTGRGSELFIKAGSTINLTCVVEDATENAPKHILWRHNSRTVNFEWARGGMSLVTEKKTKGVTVSRLLIQKAVRGDSGIYQCSPQNAHPASVKIIILEQGEKEAAMLSASSNLSYCPSGLLLLLLLLLDLLTSSSLSNVLNVMLFPLNFPSKSSSNHHKNKRKFTSESTESYL